MRIIAILAILCIFLGCGVASFYRKGVESFHKRNYKDAITWFDLSKKNKEAQPLTDYFLGVSYGKLNVYDRSIFHFRKILDNWDDSHGMKRETVTQLLKNAQIQYAIQKGVDGNIGEATGELIELSGIDYRFHLSKIYEKRNNFEKAIQALYNAFIMQNEQRNNEFIALLWYKIGDLYYLKFEKERNSSDFYNSCFAIRMAVTMNHPDPSFQKRIEEKLEFLKRNDLFKKYQPVIDGFRRIYRYKSLGDHKNIIKEAERIVNTSPVEDDVYLALDYSGKAHYELKEYMKAIEDLKRVKDYTEQKLYLTSADIYDLLEKIHAEYKQHMEKGE